MVQGVVLGIRRLPVLYPLVPCLSLGEQSFYMASGYPQVKTGARYSDHWVIDQQLRPGNRLEVGFGQPSK